MKEYLNNFNPMWYSVKCDKCGTSMRKSITYKSTEIWECPECNNTERIQKVLEDK